MLRQRLRDIRSTDDGFTLIELLIVIVILGVLAGITVFGVDAFKSDGVSAVCTSDKKNVAIAAEAYYAKNAYKYPPDVKTLVDGGYLKTTPSESLNISQTDGSVTGC